MSRAGFIIKAAAKPLRAAAELAEGRMRQLDEALRVGKEVTRASA